jgi:hypothetical protein
MKTLKVSTSQGREGSTTWLKRYIRETWDTIIWLCKTQRLLEERNEKYFKECEPTMEKVRVALASAKNKLKGNVVLQRQVMSLKR